MKVIVLGATGFIGLPTCQALVRAGHTVYGVTRSADKANNLIAEEIHPIIGDSSSCWLHLIATIDVVIQLTGGFDFARVRRTFENFIAEVKKVRSASAPKISFIQTSGAAAFGDNRIDVLSDLTPLNIPNNKHSPMMASLDIGGLEQLILKNELVNGIVIRPGMTYGRAGSLTAMLFKLAIEQDVSIVFGTPGQKRSGCHTDDLADLYVRAAEKASIIGGLTFVATAEVISVDELAKAIAEVTGAKGGVVYKEPSSPLEEMITFTQICRPFLAKSLLGWNPKKLPLIENIETYFYASIAAQAGDEKLAKALQEKFSIAAQAGDEKLAKVLKEKFNL